jgi:isonocardicin synthase
VSLPRAMPAPAGVGEDLPRRRPRCHEEPLERKPYDIFFLESAGRRWVGLKTECTFPGPSGPVTMKSTMVTPGMLLGEAAGERLSERSVFVYYRALVEAEKEAIFAAVDSARASLSYPFVHLGADRRERCAPPDYWTADVGRAGELDLGEEVLRRYSLERLRGYDTRGAVLYDPACSTGRFLGALRDALGDVRTVGQDLNPAMVELSRSRLDEVHLGTAASPCIASGSADFVFVRFLNVDVVTTASAMELFPVVAATCKPGGRIFVLGHTPVLLCTSHFEMLGFEVEQEVGVTGAGRMMFQFWVLRPGGTVGGVP